MLTHHSHSGQFCQHAKNTLEEMVLRAIELDFEAICLTEHMPRYEEKHLYPEEVASHTTLADLGTTFDAYIQEARRLEQKYASQIEILVGFEAEGINDEYLAKVEELAQQYETDLFIGSLHHSSDIPIDYDLETWQSQLLPNASVPELVQRYFERLQTVLSRLRPAVVAHYDLIRLFFPNTPVKDTAVWPLITRTVDTAIENDCMFELNSSAIRKGWDTPYPQRDIAAYIVAKNGKFCLSDDSHNVEQVGLNYQKVLKYVQSLGIEQLWRLKKGHGVRKVPVEVSRFEKWVADHY